MKNIIRAVALLIALSPRWAAAEAPPDLAKWGIYCFCLSAVSTPQKVILADNNGALLYRLRTAAKPETLRAEGAVITDSQIILMRTFGLIRKQDDGSLVTAISTFGPEVMEPARERVKAIARRVAPQLAGDARLIAGAMKEAGHADSGFAVLFGHGLDGTTWDVLRERDALPDTALSREHPLWAGAFWAAYPQRPGVPGTNASGQGNATIVAVWTDAVLTPLQTVADAPEMVAAAKAVSDGTAADAPVPVIRDGDGVDLAAKRIGAAVAAVLLDDAEMLAVLASVPTETKGEAMLVIAHEFVWDLLDELVAAGAVTPPPVLSGASGDAALRALIFILDRPAH